jgi:hypothetical protein
MKKPVCRAPPRLKKIRIDCLPYHPKVVYKPGKDIPIPDTLSRDVENPESTELDNDIEVHVILNMTNSWKATIIDETEKSDVVCMYVCMYVCDTGSRGFRHTRASHL